MKKIKWLYLILIFVLLTSCKETEETSNEPPTIVESNYIDAFGITEVGRTKNVFIDFEATVTKILVEENQKIKLNDVLVELDTTSYSGQISSKETELINLEEDLSQDVSLNGLQVDSLEENKRKNNDTINTYTNELNTIQADLNKKQKELDQDTNPDIIKLRNDLNNAQKLLEKLTSEFESEEVLYNNGVITKQQYDNSKMNLESQQKDIDNIRLSIESRTNVLKEEISELQKAVDSKAAQINSVIRDNNNIDIEIEKQRSSTNNSGNAQAEILNNEIETMKNKFNKTYLIDNSIISDVENGIVYDINCSEGDIISGNWRIFTIADLDTLHIVADVPEDSISGVNIGASAEITSIADKSQIYTGVVTSIAAKTVVKDGQSTVPVKIELDTVDDSLKLGFNVDVKIFFDDEIY